MERMINEDLVSVVVIPTHPLATLRKTLSSLLEQTYQNLEIILVDTCENLQLTEEIQQATKQYHHIHYIQVKDTKSKVEPYNKGVEKAKGKYIVLAKLEDVFAPTCIEKQLDALKKDEEAVMVCADMEAKKITGEKVYTSYYQHFGVKVYEEDQTGHLIQGNFVLGNTLCFKKEIVEATFPIPQQLAYEDWWLAFTASIQGKILYINEVLVNHYLSEEEINDLHGMKNFMKYRVEVAHANTYYYAAMTKYCREHKQHYLAIIQPMELRDKLISEYKLTKRLQYYFSEASCRCRRKIRMKERFKIWAYVCFGPYLLIIK